MCIRDSKADVKRYGMTPGCDGCLKVNRGEDSSNHSDQCRLRIEKLMSEEQAPTFEKAMKRLAEHALKEEKNKKPRVETATGSRQRTVDDTDWEDITKRVSKQIKITDGRITYTPENDMDETASSSRDKRASEPPDEQATISKKLKKDQSGAVCISCPDLDDVGTIWSRIGLDRNRGFGRTENRLIGN